MWTCLKTVRRLRLKCDGTHTETRFHLLAKWMHLFKLAGGGGGHFSRLLADELCTSSCRVCTACASLCSAVMWRLLVTHSILLFPLYFSSRASPCAITLQTQPTVVWVLQLLMFVSDVWRSNWSTCYCTEQVIVICYGCCFKPGWSSRGRLRVRGLIRKWEGYVSFDCLLNIRNSMESHVFGLLIVAKLIRKSPVVMEP
jgi:hypothetical protein